MPLSYVFVLNTSAYPKICWQSNIIKSAEATFENISCSVGGIIIYDSEYSLWINRLQNARYVLLRYKTGFDQTIFSFC